MQPMFFNTFELDSIDSEYPENEYPENQEIRTMHHIVLTLEELPPCEEDYGFQELDELAINRASRYFQTLLQNLAPFPESSPVVMIPSACQLTSHLHCSEIHIFEALQTLIDHQYEFEIRGIDGPICLRDPNAHQRKGPFATANHEKIRRDDSWKALIQQFHRE